MLQMPLEEVSPAKSLDMQPGSQQHPTKTGNHNLLMTSTGHGSLRMSYLQQQQQHQNLASMSSVGPSPLDELIRISERFHRQGEFSTAAANNSVNSAAALMPAPTAKTPPAIGTSTTSPTAAVGGLDQFGSIPFGPQSFLDPSSLVQLSSYTAAASAAHQLAPMAAAAAAAAWNSPHWPWGSAVASEALFNGGGGQQQQHASGTSQNAAPWTMGSGYFGIGNAFGGLIPNHQLGGATDQFSATSSALNNNDLASKSQEASSSHPRMATTKRPEAKKTAGNQKQRQQQQQQQQSASTAIPTMVTLSALVSAGQSDIGQKRSQNGGGGSSASHQRSGGGKLRSNVGSSAKNNCECPNCKELQRSGVPLDKKGEKHSCHIPGCHKVYSRSSHLKAHLRWHIADRPTTTKKRLFDPPDGPIGNLIPTQNR